MNNNYRLNGMMHVKALHGLRSPLVIHLLALCYFDDDFATDPSNLCSPKVFINFALSLRQIKCGFITSSNALWRICLSSGRFKEHYHVPWNCFSTQSLKVFAERWVSSSAYLIPRTCLFFPPGILEVKMGQCFSKEIPPIALAALYPLARRQFESKKVKL